MFKRDTAINVALCLSLLGLGFLWGYFAGAVSVPGPGLAYCQSILNKELIIGKSCSGPKCPGEGRREANPL